MTRPSLPRRLASGLWAGLTRLRHLVGNLLVLLLLVLPLLWWFGGRPGPLPPRAALLLNPAGTVVDEKSYTEPLQLLLGGASPADYEVLLQDVIDAIYYAADDPAITALVMQLDYLVHVGISKTQEIARAVDSFRDTGKPVIAVGDYFTQDQYLLAVHADEVILHPLGAVALEGYASYRNYFRSALQKLSVNMHVFRAGEHKSATEPWLRDDMSPGEREITGRWLQDLWQQYTETVEAARGLSAGAVNDYVNGYPQKLAEQGGDMAGTALRWHLVDRLMNRDEANAHLVDRVGAEDEQGLFEAVEFDYYLSRVAAQHAPDAAAPVVAVITASGDMLPGEQPPGTIGGDSLSALVRDTARREDIAAVVLRIDSGGGSVFAAEVIRRELQSLREAGIPLVVSMGSVAASGGYYIAAAADQVWATPATLTGSIGVFAAFPTFEGLLERVGVGTDGVGTTALAGALRLDRPLNPQLAATLESSVAFSYRQFLQLVAAGRGMTVEAVDAVAQGRVWSAGDARDLGLLDRLGDLDDAIEAAAGLAHVEDYAVEFVGQPLSPTALLLERLAKRLQGPPLSRGVSLARGPVLQGLLRPVWDAAAELRALQDPAHLYVRCIGCAHPGR